MSKRPLAASTAEKWLTDFEFRPLPFLRNPHLQTVLAALVPRPNCPLPDQRRIVRLSDGDALVLHNNTPLGWKAGDPLALLVHGLGGSHASVHIRRIAALLLSHRVRVVRMDLRGAGAGLSLRDASITPADPTTSAPPSKRCTPGVRIHRCCCLAYRWEAPSH